MKWRGKEETKSKVFERKKTRLKVKKWRERERETGEGRREKETVIGKYGMGKDYWTKV